MTVIQPMGSSIYAGRQLFLCVLPPFVQLQVVATNSALTELRDMKLVKAGAIESQDTQVNVQKRIEGACTQLLNPDIRKKLQPESASDMVNSRQRKRTIRMNYMSMER